MPVRLPSNFLLFPIYFQARFGMLEVPIPVLRNIMDYFSLPLRHVPPRHPHTIINPTIELCAYIVRVSSFGKTWHFFFFVSVYLSEGLKLTFATGTTDWCLTEPNNGPAATTTTKVSEKTLETFKIGSSLILCGLFPFPFPFFLIECIG